MKAILYYIHDPMCSWCWGFSHSLSELLEKLPVEIEVQRLLGGLAADTDLPMPETLQQEIIRNWQRIEKTIHGVKFNFDFWRQNIAKRSTYPACRAVIAARQQGEKYDSLMTQAIQKAYYQQAKNPSDNSLLIELADNLGLNKASFSQALVSEETEEILMQEIMLSRELFVESYPSLVLKTDEKKESISINYNNYSSMYESIMNSNKAGQNCTDIY